MSAHKLECCIDFLVCLLGFKTGGNAVRVSSLRDILPSIQAARQPLKAYSIRPLFSIDTARWRSVCNVNTGACTVL